MIIILLIIRLREPSVHIGNYAWIASGVTVLPGIAIGEGAVIANLFSCHKNVEPYTIVAGVPAKKSEIVQGI